MKSEKLNNLKIILLITIILLSSISVWAQTQGKVKQSSLINKNWILHLEGKSYYSILKFGNRERTDIFKTDGETSEIRNLYYLSNEADTVFQSDKVGRNKTGKYIIEQRNTPPSAKNSKAKKTGVNVNFSKARSANMNVTVYEILLISDHKLIIKNLINNSILEYNAE